MKKISLIVAIVLMGAISLYAQDTSQFQENQQDVTRTTGDTKFLLTGYGFTGFEMEGDETANFGETGFNPILLWKSSDRLFFEAELELELEGEGVELELEYADVSYVLDNYIIIRAGKFLSPFGTFQERFHPAWINKLPTKPLGFGHESVGPSSELGVELRGGIPLGPSKLNYSLYASNGPRLNTGRENPMEAGMLEFENIEDNNRNKALGGRVGILPLSNSSLEIGGSFQTAVVGDKGDPLYEDVKAKMFAADLNYITTLDFLEGSIDIKGQWSGVNVDEVSYQDPMDTTAQTFYSFDNVSTAYYAQFSYRPSLLKNKFLKNIELVARYSSISLPEKSLWGEEETQTTIGINYWLTWRSVVKMAYEITKGHGGESKTTYLLQWAIGL